MGFMVVAMALAVSAVTAAEQAGTPPAVDTDALRKAREDRVRQAKAIEAKIGREGLSVPDQLRATRNLRARLRNDPQRPRYHLMPPEGFWNDINGTIYWKGRYHVFFLGRQAPDLTTILDGKDTDKARETWLHASSHDLVHWIHHPAALVPVFDGSMPSGLYSGDMMDNMPVPTIIVHVPRQGICLYTAEDDELIRWKPHPSNPVIPVSNAPPEALVFDPCGWKEGDDYFALIGNRNKTPGYAGDSTSLFRSRDLVHWDYRGPFYRSERRWTQEWEDCACPDFFPLGNKHLLISHVHRPYHRLQYYIGTFDRQAERFLPESHGYMTWNGGSLCAPETLLDDKGRRILWGWIMEADGARSDAWASVATLPRILSLAADSSLRMEPVPELQSLRTNPRHWDNLAVSGELPLDGVRGDCLEINAVLDPGDAREFGLKVRCSPDGEEQTVVLCSPGEKTLKVEFGKATRNQAIKYPIAYPDWAKAHQLPEEKRFTKEQVAPFELRPGEPLRLRVFLDRSVLEFFANERQCVTQRIYPSRRDSLGVTLVTCGGGIKVQSLDVWDLHPVND
jgi:sucrose-6-phosphate hydrolase SacC (GH32 family)